MRASANAKSSAASSDTSPGKSSPTYPDPQLDKHRSIERLNRTLATEWAYARPWSSNDDRKAGLTTWLDHYNLDRHHLGIGGKTPIDRINNGRGQYS
ncbi:integrase core domain-containing protein [Microbacterium lacticum]